MVIGPLYLLTPCSDQRDPKRSVPPLWNWPPFALIFIFPNFGVWVRSRYGLLISNYKVVFWERNVEVLFFFVGGEFSFVPIPSAQHVTWIILFLRCEWLSLLNSSLIPSDSYWNSSWHLTNGQENNVNGITVQELW